MHYKARLLPALTISLLVSGCGNLKNLKQDLESLDAETLQVVVSTTSDSIERTPVVLLVLDDLATGDVTTLQVLPANGESKFRTFRKPVWLFAYSDLNNDLSFQAGEPWTLLNDGKAVDPGMNDAIEIAVNIPATAAANPPAELLEKQFADILSFQQVSAGTVVELSDARFSEEAAGTGLWQPYLALEAGNAGLFMLEPYDSKRTPVVLVHGINGSPRNFDALIASLDKARFQVWVFNYPSGFPLPVLGNALLQLIEVLERRYGFKELHLLAHSMGGLVSREYLDECVERAACAYLRSYTSIATSYGGMPSASMGVEYAPAVIPVWRDLAPDSEFLAKLYRHDLPTSVPFNLLFTYQHDGRGGESSDGVVALRSQLRQEAQAEATVIYGFDATHMGGLSDPLLLSKINELLSDT